MPSITVVTYQKGDYENAIVDYDKARRLDVKLALAYSNRGLAYYEKKDYDRTIADCTRAVMYNPKLATTERERSDRCQRTKHAIHVDIGRFAPVL